MSRFQVLPPYEAKQFDEPPKFNLSERKEFLVVDVSIENIISRNQNDESKVGAILQLGYFKATNKFFNVAQYRKADIRFVCDLINVTSKGLDLNKNYPSTSKGNHKTLILENLGYQSFYKNKKLFNETIQNMVRNQMLPRKIIFSVIDLFKQKKIETPSYDAFAKAITQYFHDFEGALLTSLDKIIKEPQKQALDGLLERFSEARKSRSLLTVLKNINQSEKPGQIKNSIANFAKLRDVYQSIFKLADKIGLPSEAISHYGGLVIKYQLGQMNELKEDGRRYLYLLAFVIHQYKRWQDCFLKIFKRAVRSFDQKAAKSTDATYAENAPSKNELADSISASFRDYREMVQKIEKEAFDPNINNDAFRQDVREILDAKDNEALNAADSNIDTLNDMIGQERANSGYFHEHDKLSRKLQNRVANIMKHLDFVYEKPALDLKDAIDYYRSATKISKSDAPDAFLTDTQHKYVYTDGGFNASLYRSMLFVNTYHAVNSGAISLSVSYKYLPISAYMMNEEDWKKNKKIILERLGLEEFANIDKVLIELQSILDQKYYTVNARIKSSENEHITFNSKNNDSLIVRTPAIEKPNYESVAEMIGTERNIPILEMLMSLNKFSRFTTPLTHYKVKTKSKPPKDELFIAGIFALGSDIGIERLSKSSIGTSRSKLEGVVKWYFAIENLNAVNNLLTDFMNHMSLPDLFKKEKEFLHTSSDGRKRCVSIESLMANYSYKYFGHGKGINIYTFVDERGILFYSTVFSSSDRDAPYVIDGLMHNESVKSTIHSTDTHGYTESIFSISHLLGVTFAPRIAKLSKQVLSSL